MLPELDKYVKTRMTQMIIHKQKKKYGPQEVRRNKVFGLKNKNKNFVNPRVISLLL